MPSLARADVITDADMKSFQNEMYHPSDAVTESVMAQYGTTANIAEILFKNAVKMDAVPEWKTVKSKNGITFQVPWSPSWYMLGKQIPYYYEFPDDGTTDNLYTAGRYVVDNSNTVSQGQFMIYIKKELPLAKGQIHEYNAYGAADNQHHTHFTLNRHRALLFYCECIDEKGNRTGPGCDTNKHEIIMEVKKNKATCIVIIQQNALDLSQDAFRISSSIK